MDKQILIDVTLAALNNVLHSGDWTQAGRNADAAEFIEKIPNSPLKNQCYLILIKSILEYGLETQATIRGKKFKEWEKENEAYRLAAQMPNCPERVTIACLILEAYLKLPAHIFADKPLQEIIDWIPLNHEEGTKALVKVLVYSVYNQNQTEIIFMSRIPPNLVAAVLQELRKSFLDQGNFQKANYVARLMGDEIIKTEEEMYYQSAVKNTNALELYEHIKNGGRRLNIEESKTVLLERVKFNERQLNTDPEKSKEIVRLLLPENEEEKTETLCFVLDSLFSSEQHYHNLPEDAWFVVKLLPEDKRLQFQLKIRSMAINWGRFRLTQEIAQALCLPPTIEEIESLLQQWFKSIEKTREYNVWDRMLKFARLLPVNNKIRGEAMIKFIQYRLECGYIGEAVKISQEEPCEIHANYFSPVFTINDKDRLVKTIKEVQNLTGKARDAGLNTALNTALDNGQEKIVDSILAILERELKLDEQLQLCKGFSTRLYGDDNKIYLLRKNLEQLLSDPEAQEALNENARTMGGF